MKRIVIVPARGGSKRLPDKNILLLNNKPLIYHTFDIIVDYFELIILSTDSEVIFNLCKEYPSKKVIPKMRPLYLATDSATVLCTVEYIFENLDMIFDQIWLCLPTCPLRSKEDVVNVQNLLTNDVDSVVSITDFDFPPTLGLNMDMKGIITENNIHKPFATGNTRSQDHNIIYRPNGAFYGSWWKSFNKNRNFFKGKVKGYYMSRVRSIDIDTATDLKIAEALIRGE